MLGYSQERIEITGQFRGVWISTVKRLDYPPYAGMRSEQLKAEFIKILDSCKAIGINAIIFQVRPAADAFYASPYEPWSEWLTGKQGRAPSPYFDPLEFMIDETHKRNMQFHAWINPFRAVATIGKANVQASHISNKQKDWFFVYGKNKYFNPGVPAVRNYVIKIIVDIVNRYDIDAIHFDDYFYPYPLRDDNNEIIEIPDYQTFSKYGKGFKNIKDWRRNNINIFIRNVHDTIKAIKPWVKFGVSPPAVWRNKGYDPDGSATLGLAAYDWLYADVLTWLKNGWIDYVAPQLYWYIGHKRANYSVLIDWWAKHNYNTDLYIGLNIHAIDPTRKDKHWGNPNEIPKQIKLAKKYPQVKGFVLYRYKSLSKNPLGIKDSLRNNYFADTNNVTLIALATTLDTETLVVDNQVDTSIVVVEKTAPQTPVDIDKYRIGKEISIVWTDTEQEHTAFYRIYKFEGKNIIQLDAAHIFATTKQDYYRFMRKNKLMIFGKKYWIVVTAVNSSGVESKPSKPIRLKL